MKALCLLLNRLRNSWRIAIRAGLFMTVLTLIGRAASSTWTGGGTDGVWSTITNWVSNIVPGSTSSTTNTDVATFNAPIANTWGNSAGNPVVVDSGRNIGGINFDAAAGNYFIGSTSGNALNMTSGGVIQVLNTLTATNAVFTVNAPLVIQSGGQLALANYSANGTGAGAGTLKFGGTISGTSGNSILTLAGKNTNANTISGVIRNGLATSLSLNMADIGTWVLTAANTYTGSTQISRGTLVLSFGSVSANILPSASALILNGGTLQLAGTGTQTVNGLSVNPGGSRILLGASETLALGGLTSVGNGSTLNFNTAAGGANASATTIGTSIIVLTGQTAGTAINSGFTVTDAGGFGLATVNASNQVVRSTTTTLLPASGATSATDYRIDNNAGSASTAGSSTLTISASQSAKSITVDTTAASGVVTLGSGFVLSNNIWNFGGAGSNTWQITGSTSGAGLKALTAHDSIDFNNYNTGTVTIASPILDNTTTPVLVYGTGTIVFSGANTYGGGTLIEQGTVQFAKTNAMPAFGQVSVETGATLVVNAGGPGEFTNGTSGNGTLGGLFSGLGGQSGGTVRPVNPNYNIGIDTTNAGGSLTYTGNIADFQFPGLSLIKLGTGTLSLTGSNSYTGGTTVSAGVLMVNADSALGAASGFIAISNNATLRAAGNVTASGRNLIVGTGGAQIDTNGNNIVVGGAITGSANLTKIGSGILQFNGTGANTYSASVNVNAGTLLVDTNLTGASINVANTATLGGTGSVSSVSIGASAILEGGDGTAASGALTSGSNVSLTTGAHIELTLGPGATTSRLTRTGGTWSFDLNQAFVFNIVPGASVGTYDNLITGLSGTETGLANISHWTISTPGVVGTFTYDGAGDVDLTVSTIPESGTATLLLAGVSLLGWRRRRRG